MLGGFDSGSAESGSTPAASATTPIAAPRSTDRRVKFSDERSSAFNWWLAIAVARLHVPVKAVVREIQLAAAVWIVGPGVKVTLIRKVVVDEARERSGDEGVTVAMTLQVILDCLRFSGDAA